MEIRQRMYSKALCRNSHAQISDIESDDKETDELEGAADEMRPTICCVHATKPDA
jgi:hypothetical protein